MVWSINDLVLPQLAESEYRLLFNHFDRKNEGKIDWNLVIDYIKSGAPLNNDRMTVVRRAYGKMDKSRR